ncbi:choice-of-anchor A family protein [Arthrobacter sp. NPDC090010]|uniref:choice-of-anchor A family protein n=1 Tax=Arthrobacter sp. NPDC090010 TaxID=3363942 RepID=UPI0037FC41AD
MNSTLRRFGAPSLSLAAGAVAVFAATAMAFQAVPAARAAAVDCVPNLPGIEANPAPDGYDNRPNLFVKGAFTVVQSAAEMEGKAVVLGNADIAKANGIYNVGTAGVGSGLWPQPGTDHLVVGGSLRASSGVTVDVGANNTPGGGAVSVGGDIEAPKLTSNGGKITSGDSSSADSFRNMPGRIVSTSASYAALPTTGRVSVTSWGLDLLGDGVSATQVFTVDGAVLGTAVRSLEVKNVPAGARVIVNVTGGPKVTLGLNALLVNGTPVPISSSAFGELAGHILWNYTEASDVHVTGSAQVPGSMLVPVGSGTTTIDVPGYNGRVYVNGDFVHGGSGSEVHAYPFPDELTGCTVDPQPTPTPTRPDVPQTPIPTGTTTSPVPTESVTSPVPTGTVTSPVPTESVTSPVPTGTATSAGPSVSGTTSAPAGTLAATTSSGGDLAVTGASSALLPTALAAVGLLALGGVTLLAGFRRNGRH